MSKKWIAELAALAISFSSITSLHGENLPSPGKEIVMEVESAYRKGEYDHFLKDMHIHFQHAGKAGALRGIFESAKVAMQNRSPQTPRLDPSQLTEMEQKRNQLLLEAISHDPHSEIAGKVYSVVGYSIDPKAQAVLSELDKLKYKIPETAKANIDNKISALETEYYIKSLLLDIGYLKTQSSPEEIAKKKLALTLEKLDKMEEASKEYQDKKWEQKIQIAKEAFLVEKAFRVDNDVLNMLADGKIEPKSIVEKNVQEIMMEYQQHKQSGLDSYHPEIVIERLNRAGDSISPNEEIK